MPGRPSSAASWPRSPRSGRCGPGGVPPARAGALREDWERRAAVVESYREAAGITDPAQAIGPVPSGQAQLSEAFHASVLALELPGEQALLRAPWAGASSRRR